MPKRRPVEDRFWEKVDKRSADECWLWTACVNERGYGILAKGGKYGGTMLAHRYSFFLQFGRWPKHGACHTCDTPRCNNPFHLFDGDQTDNMMDAARKGRTIQGEKHPRAKLTDIQATEIISRAKNEKQRDLAFEFGVSEATVSEIVNRRHWQHLKVVQA